MSSILSTLSVGRSGLQIASEAINVIGHNTANAATEGYSRQALRTSSASPIQQGGLWIGQGVAADDRERITDFFVSERLTDARGDAASSEASYRAHQIIEVAFTGDRSVANKLSAFFDSLHELSADPADDGHRIVAISAGEDLAASVTETYGQLVDIQDGVEEQLASSIEGINQMLERVAALNGLVASGGSGDLADERDALINELAERLGVTADHNGSAATVFLGGHALVMGQSSRVVSMDLSGSAPVLQISADDAILTVTDVVGGEAGGLLGAWQTAETLKGDLDTLVTSFTDAFNAQHQAGFDANGAGGEVFFSLSASDPAATLTVNASLLADPDRLALAAAATATAGDRGNLDQLLALQEQPLVDGETPESFLSRVYTDLGDAVRKAELAYTTDQASLEDAQSLRESTSGVDLDEEAANLIAWQAAYQAAARVISASNEMLGELMNLAG